MSKPIITHYKTHCPAGHAYDEANTYVTSQGAWLCRTCKRERQQTKQYPKHYNREKQREHWLRSKYKLTPESYTAMLAAQDNRCASCADEFSDSMRPAVDHDHRCCPGAKSCGKCVRSLLCGSCNSMLGHAKDDVARLMAAQLYLLAHQ